MTLECMELLAGQWQAAGVKIFPHQLDVAQKVVEKMNGRAILADEVGLGKTIEAGIIIWELMLRQQASTILILTPASLVQQWCEELVTKFDLKMASDPEELGWLHEPLICVSIDKAKRDPQRSMLIQRNWDIVIVDEAHRLKNANSQSHHLIRSLRARNLLLLSATPMQNDLHELYNLVSLVRPDLFGSFRRFQNEFAIARRVCKNPEKLKEILNQVMIRNKRNELEMNFPEREVALLPVDMSQAEKRLYDTVTELVRQEYWQRLRSRSILLPLLTLQKEVCSSPAALLESLTKMDTLWMAGEATRLQTLAQEIESYSKAEVLLHLVQEVGQKMIVFTEYRATQRHLYELLRRAEIEVVEYHGGLTAVERSQAIKRFADNAQILLSTECGGQGLNLQFCRHVVNYDLPWNPMRVEQRIGRVHRIGQEGTVSIYNLYAKDSMEEYVLRLLDEKINLFRKVIGELDMIIRHFEEKRSLEARILEIAITSKSSAEAESRLDDLGDQLMNIRKQMEERFVTS